MVLTVVESEFTPASFPASIWSLGMLVLRTSLPKDEVERRLQSLKAYSLADAFTGFGVRPEYRQRRCGGKFQVWRRTYWAGSPHQGASLWELGVTDTGVGSELRGTYRLGYGLLVVYALVISWLLFFTAGLSAAGLGWYRLIVLFLISAQLVMHRLTANRGLAAVRYEVVDLMGGTSAVEPINPSAIG
jgi:hypothetical protein